MKINFDLQLFGGGGSRTQTVEVPVYKQSAAPSHSSTQMESATDSTHQKTAEKMAKARGRRNTVTGAGLSSGNALNTSDAAAQIKKLLGE